MRSISPAYISTTRAMSDDEYRAQVLARAHRELLTWKFRYRHLKDFASVFDPIDHLEIA